MKGKATMVDIHTFRGSFDIDNITCHKSIIKMNKHTKYNLLAVFLAFVGMITLGGLGNAAVTVDKFYWFPFVVNFGVYGYLVYKCYKESDKE